MTSRLLIPITAYTEGKMDYLDEFKRTKNNLENRTQNKNFTLEYGRVGSEGRRPAEQEANLPYSYGDRIVLGVIPGGSVVTKCTTLVEEGFDTGTELLLEFSADFPVLALSPLLQNGDTILVDADNASIQSYLSKGGNTNSDGTPLADGSGLATIWLGTDVKPGDYYIVGTFTGGTGELSVGHLDVILEYNRFGTNEGAY